MSGALPYDALLLFSFGGPEGMADVEPFLDRVLRGRPVPPERRRQVAQHYAAFGGVSPINARNRALLEAIRADLDAHGPRLPLYWGNRNWHPFLADTLVWREMLVSPPGGESMMVDSIAPGNGIRAPVVTEVGDDVDVLATLEDGKIVATQSGHILATAFHPELTDDNRFHEYFLKLAREK